MMNICIGLLGGMNGFDEKCPAHIYYHSSDKLGENLFRTAWVNISVLKWVF